ncbi:SET domain-containing protein [Auriscalpium vulgare]|uniref:SET domain-containing protein n=1 Tax=Auriscalpium vulgare TaxID=40419 RepID=A0ACB8S534_9AGAM|nr:SET domain-containing protein [Auriscalpium vulgare]
MPRATPIRFEDEDFRRSKSPPEDWGDTQEDDEWPVEGIVGEHFDVMGGSMYQIRWANWRRPDGTNTTWAGDVPSNLELLDEWENDMKEQNHRLSTESSRVKLQALSFSAAHDRRTAEMSEAYKEKHARWEKEGAGQLLNWDADVQYMYELHDDSAKRAVPVQGEALQIRPLPRRLTASPSTNRGISRTISVRTIDRGRISPKTALQEKLNSATKRVGAAPLTIVSAPGRDDIPALPEDFIYREAGYSYPPDLLLPDDAAFVHCDCRGNCTKASNCDCQEETNYGKKIFAYTTEGLLSDELSGGNSLIIECNHNCTCSMDCRNRVAQRPRDTPLELYDTLTRGWGIRSTVRLPANKVLGCYAGELIYRTDADAITRGNAGVACNYLFDLDGTEFVEEEDEEEKPYSVDEEDEEENAYSVDAYHQGNWTRFVNHSCEPNLRVFNVVYDSIPEMKMPHLAFVTLKEIPAGTELTLDYDPKSADDWLMARPKGKKVGNTEMPSGSTGKCMCGTDSCRGWLSRLFSN